MSADDPDVVIDLTDWDGTVPDEWVLEAEDGDVPDDPDLSTMTEWERESWAAEDGIGRAEERRRLGLVVAHDEAHAPRSTAPAAASGWDDVPLDGILDAIAAGTFSLPVPTVGMLADGTSGLFYPGRVNGLAGESGAGKGWLALTVSAQRMLLGFHTFYLDFEDGPALSALRLVKVLGVDPNLVRGQFHYLHPSSHDDAQIAAFVERVAQFPGALVIIDSTGESMAAAGLNQNHDEEVAAWFQSLAHPLADRAGATVLLLDHMVKSEDGGLWPIGSQRKRAAITGAQYVAEVARPFSKTTDGLVALRVAKDRHGAREARAVATYVQFVHPVVSQTTLPDGSLEMVMGEALTVHLGNGKTSAQAQADRDKREAAALAADVAQIAALDPRPTSYRDVKTRLRWQDKRAQAAMRAWREGAGA